MAECGRQKVKTAHILRNCVKKRLATDPTIHPSLFAKLIACPVDRRYDAIIKALVDNRPDCFDDSVLRLQEGFIRFFRDASGSKQDCYEKYCEMLLEKIFNNGCHIHSNKIYETFLLVFAIARDRLLANEIERVELLITWTDWFFNEYSVDEWIEAQGGWEQLPTKPFDPKAPGGNLDPPFQRVTIKPDYVEDSEGNISIPQTTTGAQQCPFYGNNLEQPYVTNPQQSFVTNPQQPYTVHPVQLHLVNVRTPYLINPQTPHPFVPSQYVMALPQQPYMVNPQPPYVNNPQSPDAFEQHQQFIGNPPQPYMADRVQPPVGDPESNIIAQEEVVCAEGENMFH